jgi:hypothetical protein
MVLGSRASLTAIFKNRPAGVVCIAVFLMLLDGRLTMQGALQQANGMKDDVRQRRLIADLLGAVSLVVLKSGADVAMGRLGSMVSRASAPQGVRKPELEGDFNETHHFGEQTPAAIFLQGELNDTYVRNKGHQVHPRFGKTARITYTNQCDVRAMAYGMGGGKIPQPSKRKRRPTRGGDEVMVCMPGSGFKNFDRSQTMEADAKIDRAASAEVNRDGFARSRESAMDLQVERAVKKNTRFMKNKTHVLNKGNKDAVMMAMGIDRRAMPSSKAAAQQLYDSFTKPKVQNLRSMSAYAQGDKESFKKAGREAQRQRRAAALFALNRRVSPSFPPSPGAPPSPPSSDTYSAPPPYGDRKEEDEEEDSSDSPDSPLSGTVSATQSFRDLDLPSR